MRTINKLSLISYALLVVLLCLAGMMGLTAGVAASADALAETAVRRGNTLGG